MGGLTPDLMAQLAPAHAPPAAGWWPLAWGWWCVIGVVALSVVIALVLYYLPRQRLRRKALRQLHEIETASDGQHELANRLERLMRWYAIHRFGKDMVANLSGQRWIAFVTQHHGTAFAGETGDSFLRAAWGKLVSETAPEQPQQWILGVRQFIKKS